MYNCYIIVKRMGLSSFITKYNTLCEMKFLNNSRHAFVSIIYKLYAVVRGWQRGGRDPVSRTNFNKIHASRFESVIVGETSGKRNFHDQTQIIHESRIPHEINHASHAFRYSRITCFLSNFHASRSSFIPYHASRINPLPPSCSFNMESVFLCDIYHFLVMM